MGRYQILEQLGEGGMAMVYKAFDTRLKTEVAVKVIRMDNLSLQDKSRIYLAPGVPMAWSPDGHWIINTNFKGSFSKARELYLVDASIGTSYPLTNAEGSYVAWQPSSGLMVDLPAVPSPDGSLTPSTSKAIHAATVSPQSGCAEVTITVRRTSKGEYLLVCAGEESYDVGPLERGAFAVGPNEKFFVYCSYSGKVYASRIGTTSLVLIGDVSDFTIIAQNEAPNLEFEFTGNHPYSLKIHEQIMNQDQTLSIPRTITTPN